MESTVRFFSVFSLILVSCGTPTDGGGGGGSHGTGGSSSGKGGSSASGGGSGEGGGSSTGGGASAAGGGSFSSGGGTASSGGGSSAGGGSASSSAIKKVFVIAFENQGTTKVYNTTNAPFLNNSLMTRGGYATMYGDVLTPDVPSEPHYVWMEAGTNVFSDHTFASDDDPSMTNSTSSTEHLATQLTAAGKTWRAYEESLDSTKTGDCPIVSESIFTVNPFAAKHDPFVFFQDVSGNPPSKTNAACAAHHKAYTAQTLQADLQANDVADYTFITPNLCNDMHGAACLNGCIGVTGCISAGDKWMQDNVGPILDYINTHDAVLFLIWDEPESTSSPDNQPFVVLGPHVKNGYASGVAYNHSSYVKSLEEIFKVPVMSPVSSANDFSDFFETGYFP
jgi:hypothetical protein